MRSWLLNERSVQARDNNVRLYSLQELAFRLNRSFDQRTILEHAVEWAARLGFGAAVLWAQPGDGRFRLEAAAGLTRQALDALGEAHVTVCGDTLAGQAACQQRAIVVADAPRDERFADLRELARSGAFRAAMALPLVADERCPAVLLIYAACDLDSTTTGLLDLLARQTALALNNARTIGDLKAREALLEQRHRQLRRAYDLVAAERRTLAAVLDCAGDAVLVTDAEGIVQLGNQAVEGVLGIHPDLLIGGSLQHPDVPESLALLISQARARAGHQEGELGLPDGRVFHISVAPVQTLDWPIQAYVTLLKDVTYFKRLDELKSQFVATVSHDMKSPLNIINSYTELLELAGPLNREQSGYVERIMASVRQLTALVSDLLDLARIESHVGMQMAPCDIGGLIQAVVDDHLLLADEKRISLVIRVLHGLPPVWGDEGRLRQVVSNLISNALTYTPQDGAIWLSAEAGDGMVTVRIEDSGIGINPGDIQHIFDPFFRTGSARAVNREGTGLGLAIVKRIVEEHGGAIGVESAINGGSTFWFSLPIARMGHEKSSEGYSDGR